MLICIQCALEAFVASGGRDWFGLRAACSFNETPEAHARRCHPDLQKTIVRRRYLEEEAASLMGETLVRPEENN